MLRQPPFHPLSLPRVADTMSSFCRWLGSSGTPQRQRCLVKASQFSARPQGGRADPRPGPGLLTGSMVKLLRAAGRGSRISGRKGKLRSEALRSGEETGTPVAEQPQHHGEEGTGQRNVSPREHVKNATADITCTSVKAILRGIRSAKSMTQTEVTDTRRS